MMKRVDVWFIYLSVCLHVSLFRANSQQRLTRSFNMSIVSKPVANTTPFIRTIRLEPVISTQIQPTVYPSRLTTYPPQLTSVTNDMPGGAISGGAIAGITVSTIILTVLLCVILTMVCLITICAKKSRTRTRRQKKTYGKARFIQSLYILPKHYKASKNNTTNKNAATDEDVTAAPDLTCVRGEAAMVVKGIEKGVGKERDVDQVTNNDFSKTPDQAIQADTIEDYYENNPYARGYFQERDKTKLEKKDYENTGVYLNQEEFKRPTALPTHSNNNENDLYVNTFLARENLAVDSPVYVNQGVLVSIGPNKAYGITDRSQLQVLGEDENGGEDEYVYVETNRDGPEDEYEDMALFVAH